MGLVQMSFLFKGVIFRFHVSFGGSIFFFWIVEKQYLEDWLPGLGYVVRIGSSPFIRP